MKRLKSTTELFSNVSQTETSPVELNEDEEQLATKEIHSMEPLDKKSSNKVFLVKFKDESRAIFKPQNGEAPMLRAGIKPGTYYKRERAAYLINKFLGLDIIPPTVLRTINGQVGSLQTFVTNPGSIYDIPEMGRFLLSKNRELDDLPNVHQLRVGFLKLLILDYVIWNSDRDFNNVLWNGEQIHAIDNSLSFSEQTKLWLAKGPNPRIEEMPIPDKILKNFNNLVSDSTDRKSLTQFLTNLIGEQETASCIKRIEYLSKVINQNGKIPKEVIVTLSDNFEGKK